MISWKRWILLLMSFIFVFVLPISSSLAGDNTWTSIGLLGGNIEQFSFDPKNQNIIWAAVSQLGLYRSIDAGATWEIIESSPSEIEEVAISPADSNTVFVVGQLGVYRSVEAGINWQLINAHGSYAIAISPLDSNIIIIGGERRAYVGVEEGGIFQSTDGGETWIRAGGELPSDMVREIVFAPSAPYIIYAACFDGLYKSIDHGLTWKVAHNGFISPPMLYSVAVDPYDSDVVYMGTGQDGIYRSSNGGESWQPIGTGLGTTHVASIAIDPGNQQVIYVGGGINPSTGTPGVYRSIDNLGNSWQPYMDGMGSRAIYDIKLDKSNPQNIYAATYGGMWKFTVVAGPEDYRISVNDGALFTNQTDVSLNLIVPSGTSEMIISNDGGFADATWEPFDNEKDWTLQACGGVAVPSTVYAKFRTLGEISGQYQDDIVIVTGGSVGGATIPPAAPMPLSPWVVVPGLLVLGLGATAFWLERRKK